MIQIEIDGKQIKAQEGDSIIEVADKHGIYIPRYCYHKKLSVAANCRMCLVEVEKSRKPLPACATPVSEGMKIFTQSPLALQAQRDVMSFLLINHPLDCPVCDQGGECELQDFAMGYGRDESDYDQNKRAVKGPELGPLIQTYMTRCIQCTRCVRYGEEIAGVRELGVINRGENEAITASINNTMKSEVSANIIDMCPVGALTAKPVKYSGRSWSYYEHEGIASHDCLGSHVYLHTLRNDNASTHRVMRLVPKEEPTINECWIADRDRFGFMGLDHADRATEPMMKIKGEWKVVPWEQLLSTVADRLKAVSAGNGDELGALISPQATLEEQYLFQQFARALGTPHIDSRLRTQDFSDQSSRPTFPALSATIDELVTADAVIVIGGDLRREQPVLVCRMNSAPDQEERLMYEINSYETQQPFPVRDSNVVSRDAMPATVASLVAAVKAAQGESAVGCYHEIDATTDHVQWASSLLAVDNVVIVLGEQVDTLENAATIRAHAAELARSLDAKIGELSHGPNTAGAWQAGCLPHRGPAGVDVTEQGLDALSLLTISPKKVYCLFQVEPEHDLAAPAQSLKALQAAEMVIAFGSYASEALREVADFILPIAPFTETAGTYVNVEGKHQPFNAVSVPPNDVRPGWKVLRVLANFCDLEGFDYRTIDEVRAHITKTLSTKAALPKLRELPGLQAMPTAKTDRLVRVSIYPTVAADAALRRCEPLAQTLPSSYQHAGMHPKTAAQHGLENSDRVLLSQGDSQITLPLRLDISLAQNQVFVPSGIAETAGFGQIESDISVEKASG